MRATSRGKDHSDLKSARSLQRHLAICGVIEGMDDSASAGLGQSAFSGQI
jgi:hypothetical protein